MSNFLFRAGVALNYVIQMRQRILHTDWHNYKESGKPQVPKVKRKAKKRK